MKLSDLSIRRPVLATVLSLGVLLLGLIAYDRISVREYPNIDEPAISVTTIYLGASPQIMETEITTVIEDSLAGLEGLKTITSKSRQESSEISITFLEGRNPDSAAADVRDRVGRVRGKLPSSIEEPIIAKVEADASPIMYLAFSSDRHSMGEITDYLDRRVKDRIETIPGVASAQIFGERRYAMRIWLDPTKMAAYSVTAPDVESALRSQNIEVPGGRIESSAREFTILTDTGLETPEDFTAIVLRNESGYLVRLGDVARVEIGSENERVNLRHNGKNALALGLVKTSTANPLEISSNLKKMLPLIQESLPEGMNINLVYDSSIFIERSIANVYSTIFEAVLLVLLVIFVFLRSVRATLIPLITIPISLIGAFFIMWVLGFSINTLTLLALVLAVGLVVDDAIVMLENIHRHVEKGLSPFRAALKGSREIGFAIIAMTLTLVAVFAPVALMEGRTGKLFTEFALTLAGAVLVSGFVALTLTPMMCSKLLKHEANPGPVMRILERFFVALESSYSWLLEYALKARYIAMALVLVSAGGSYYLFQSLPSELAPVEDRGTIVGVHIAPDGATLEYTDSYAKQIEELYRGIPEADSFFMITGFPLVSEGVSFLDLKDWDERERSQQQIAGGLAGPMFSIPGVLAFPINPPSLGQSPMDQPVQFVIKTTGSWEELSETMDKLMARVRGNSRIVAARTDLKLSSPEIRVSVDRDRAADLGVDVATLGRTIETFMGGREVTRFKMDGEQYEVIVKAEDDLRTTPQDLNAIYVRAASGEMIPLASLVSIEETVAAQALNHFGKNRAATISANLAPGYSLGEALGWLNEQAGEVLPEGAFVDYAGESREFFESSSGLLLTFVLALTFIYLMLAAQFESFVDPFIILLTVPLSMLGALLALKLTGNSLNIYSQMGLITLIGLITKNGILIVEFANQLQMEGRNKFDAVLEASRMRLRPVLMTAGTMVLGAIPLALATGAGAESRAQLGWVIVGGMAFGTLLTLFVVPAAYLLLARKREQLQEDETEEATAAGTQVQA